MNDLGALVNFIRAKGMWIWGHWCSGLRRRGCGFGAKVKRLGATAHWLNKVNAFGVPAFKAPTQEARRRTRQCPARVNDFGDGVGERIWGLVEGIPTGKC